MLKKIPYLLGVASIVGGVFISILFGVNEELFKHKIDHDLRNNPSIQQIVSPEEQDKKIKSETDKHWRYYQRYHFHATGIGAMILGLLFFLNLLQAPQNLKLTAGLMTGVGGFLYPFVWLAVALTGPVLGRSEAKETFAILGYSGGLFLTGAILIFVLGIKYKLKD